MDKDIREFFRAERKARHLTQAEVAEGSGGDVTQGTISKIERDPPYDPGIKSFLRAIRGLGMKPSEFFARFEQRAGSTTSDSLGQSEKTNVRLITQPRSAQTIASPIPSEAADERAGLSNPTLEEMLAAFIKREDRLVASIERLAKAGGKKPPRRAARRSQGRKTS